MTGVQRPYRVQAETPEGDVAAVSITGER